MNTITITDDEILKAGRPPNGVPPWGIGSDRRYFLDAVRAVLALAESKSAAKVAELEAELEAHRLYARALCKAVDAATDFAGTVAGGASWWDDVWADHTAALDRARERISQAQAAQPAQVAATTQAEPVAWQPMKTAPKDNQLCAVHAPGAMVCDVWPARWNAEHGNFEAGGGWFEPEEVVSWIALPEPAPKREGGSDV